MDFFYCTDREINYPQNTLQKIQGKIRISLNLMSVVPSAYRVQPSLESLDDTARRLFFARTVGGNIFPIGPFRHQVDDGPRVPSNLNKNLLLWYSKHDNLPRKSTPGYFPRLHAVQSRVSRCEKQRDKLIAYLSLLSTSSCYLHNMLVINLDEGGVFKVICWWNHYPVSLGDRSLDRPTKKKREKCLKKNRSCQAIWKKKKKSRSYQLIMSYIGKILESIR